MSSALGVAGGALALKTAEFRAPCYHEKR